MYLTMQIHHNTVVYFPTKFHPKGKSTALTDKILYPQNNRQRQPSSPVCANYEL
jgi:hypothetical protein